MAPSAVLQDEEACRKRCPEGLQLPAWLWCRPTGHLPGSCACSACSLTRGGQVGSPCLRPDLAVIQNVGPAVWHALPCFLPSTPATKDRHLHCLLPASHPCSFYTADQPESLSAMSDMSCGQSLCSCLVLCCPSGYTATSNLLALCRSQRWLCCRLPLLCTAPASGSAQPSSGLSTAKPTQTAPQEEGSVITATLQRSPAGLATKPPASPASTGNSRSCSTAPTAPAPARSYLKRFKTHT